VSLRRLRQAPRASAAVRDTRAVPRKSTGTRAKPEASLQVDPSILSLFSGAPLTFKSQVKSFVPTRGTAAETPARARSHHTLSSSVRLNPGELRYPGGNRSQLTARH
jgi:hypothetical protein